MKEVALAKLTVALLIVAVPVAAPKLSVVAAPPMLREVAIVFSKLKDVWVVVRSPPLIAVSPEVVMFPVAPAIDQLVPDRSFSPAERAVTRSASETSIADVYPPDSDWIFNPIGWAR